MVNEGVWVDDLVPATDGVDFVLDTLARLSLVDNGQAVKLGPADLATFGLLRRMLQAPRANLLLELPRGKHDFAILCGLFVRIALLIAARRNDYSAPAAGPVVIVGMNTMAHERLRRIKLAGVQLAEGLVACRLRSDGRLVSPAGSIVDVRAYPEALVYLNTRVGWPGLPPEIRPSVVVIDRTSFASPDILERALAWADTHGTAKVIVVADLGDEVVEQAVLSNGRTFLKWPWSQAVLAELTWELGKAPASSALSMNGLSRATFEPVHAAPFTAAAIDDAFRSLIRGFAEARKIAEPWPRPLQQVRRLTFGLAQLLSTVDEYNQWAALDYRTTSLSSIVYQLEGSGHQDSFSGSWGAYGETRWGDLRLDALKLYQLVHDENPKFYALAYALERVEADRGESVVIRVPNEASGLAVEALLRELVPERAVDGQRVRWVSWADRLPWTREQTVEIHPAAPPPSRLPALWSAECTYELYLVYPFELELLNSALGRVARKRRGALSETAQELGLSGPPSRSDQSAVDIAYTFDIDRRPRASDGPLINLEVETSVLFDVMEDVMEEDKVSADVGISALGVVSVEARPVIVEPDGSWWWIREGRQVEALVGDKVAYLGLDELLPGTAVLVPRGEGREELFGRLVAAAHRRGDMQAFEVLFRRWRDACWTAYRSCGGWGEVENRMRAEGSKVTWQSPRTWAVGSVIAPVDPDDIARIGRLSGDTLIEVQYRRLARMANQVRGLHAKLGRLLSAAMAEAVDRGGPSLDALTKLLGTDPSELLDEFDLRAVREIGPVQTIPSSDVRKLVTPPRRIRR